jgi:8-oxo-dGTP pyrophosphatase MutT (NUDIX family)
MAGQDRPWKVLESRYAVADRWLRLRSDLVSSPDGHSRPLHHVLEHPDWVDVIALTADLNIVVVDQYRHAVGRVSTEFPAGTVDGDEEPLVAIKRELLEETGYTSAEWHLLGTAPVCPSLQTNRIRSFLALNARRVAGQALDDGEFIKAYELPFAEFIDKVRSGSIELPGLQLAGLWWLQARLKERGVPGTSIPFL